ncbi:MAG: hypothetical protein HKN18_11055 [Silicimonas sp.]|nr:hypothetical protein [Silicimonas sp.]
MSGLFSIWTLVGLVSLVVIWRTLVLGARVAEALRLPRWDRNIARRVLYRGVVNAPDDARPAIARYRREVLACYAMLALVAAWAIGPNVLVLIAAVALIAFYSKPFDPAQGDQ